MATTHRTQQTVIRPDHPLYGELEALSIKAGLLYNQTNYRVRQAFFKRESLSIYTIKKNLKDEQHEAYKALPSKIARDTILAVRDNWKSFYEVCKAKKQGKDVKPRIPRYLKGDKRYVVHVSKDTIRDKAAKRGWLSFMGVSQDLVRIPVGIRRLKSARIVPRPGYFIVEVVYLAKVRPNPIPSQVSKKWAGIDLGIDNLATVSVDDPHVRPLIVDGKQAKAWNNFANKQTSRLKSKLKQGTYSSTAIRKTWDKRNRRLKTYMHWASRQIVDYAVRHGVDTLVIGWNPGWKSDKSDMGKKFNQTFRSMPLGNLVDLVVYKAAAEGIEVVLTEESYTSKTSVLHGEMPYKLEDYSARRKHRGLLVGKRDGRVINADVNGACQIVRKRNPEAFTWAEGLMGMEGLCQPVKVAYGRSLPSVREQVFTAQRKSHTLSNTALKC